MVIFICFSSSQSWDQLVKKRQKLQNNIQERLGNRRCPVPSCSLALCCCEDWLDQGSLKMRWNFSSSWSCFSFWGLKLSLLSPSPQYWFFFLFREIKRTGVCFNRRAIVTISNHQSLTFSRRKKLSLKFSHHHRHKLCC